MKTKVVYVKAERRNGKFLHHVGLLIEKNPDRIVLAAYLDDGVPFGVRRIDLSVVREIHYAPPSDEWRKIKKEAGRGKVKKAKGKKKA